MSRERRKVAAVWVAAVVLGVGALAFAGCGGDSGSDSAAACASELPTGLTPPGEGPSAYTMGLRVNKTDDVDDFAASGFADRIEPRDVFVVNTEFPGGSPEVSRDIVASLGEKFPCNRIATLNGLGTDENKPGYMLALAGEPEVDAILVDWEPDTWETAGQGAWTADLERNLARIEDQLKTLSKELESTETRMGLVPDYLPPWDYGQTAKVIGQANWELNQEHRGFQLVQTQPNCGTASAPGPLIGGAAAKLRDQYKPLFALEPGPKGWQKAPQSSDSILQHLGFEIAFDTTPDPHASTAVDRIGPAQAASCSDEILKAGGAAILYWASPSALEAMLATPVGRQLRPANQG